MGLQDPVQVSPKDHTLTLTFCDSNRWWKIAAALIQMLVSYWRSQTTVPLWQLVRYYESRQTRAIPGKWSSKRGASCDPPPRLKVNVNESVKVDLANGVAIGHTPAFRAKTESEEPSYFVRGTKTDKSNNAARRFANQAMNDLTDQRLLRNSSKHASPGFEKSTTWKKKEQQQQQKLTSYQTHNLKEAQTLL